MDKINVVSFSGGRTSAYMVYLIEQMRESGWWDENIGGDVHYMFIDTGAEHPKTYEFIKNCVSHFGIELHCISAKCSTEVGTGVDYEEISIDDIGCNLKPWESMVSAYGTPFNPGGAFCTDRMKSRPADKYCKDKFNNNCNRWLGYRIDESKRSWGNTCYSYLSAVGFDSVDAAELMAECLKDANNIESKIVRATGFCGDLFSSNDDRLEKLCGRVSTHIKNGFRFMFEITDLEKQDVLDFWSSMPFDLEIEEWSGNCVFCIKKGENKVALAAKDNPELADQFEAMIDSSNVRDMPNDGVKRKDKTIMFRGYNSLRSIREKYKDVSREELVASLRGNKSMDAGSCSESCEVYSDQMDLIDLDVKQLSIDKYKGER